MNDSRVINQAAKELLGVFMYESSQERIDREWSKLDDVTKMAWIRVAEHAVKQSTELFGMLIEPDYR